MKAPLNRKVFVVGYGAATSLGNTFAATWEAALAGRAGFRRISRCEVTTRSNVVGEIPDWDPSRLEYVGCPICLSHHGGVPGGPDQCRAGH